MVFHADISVSVVLSFGFPFLLISFCYFLRWGSLCVAPAVLELTP